MYQFINQVQKQEQQYQKVTNSEKRYKMNLRRELRKKFEDILSNFSDKLTLPEREPLADLLADAALSVSAIAKRATDEDQGEYNTELFRGDWREYPERLHKIAETLRDVWKFTLPPKPAKGEGKGQYAFYIQSMDAIKQSCAEFGADVLVKVHADWKAGFKNGLAPYTVAQPTSLVNMCAAKARELREAPEKSESPIYKPYVPEDETKFVPAPTRLKL